MVVPKRTRLCCFRHTDEDPLPENGDTTLPELLAQSPIDIMRVLMPRIYTPSRLHPYIPRSALCVHEPVDPTVGTQVPATHPGSALWHKGVTTDSKT